MDLYSCDLISDQILPLDIYPLIMKWVGWEELMVGCLVSVDMYFICKAEMEKRISHKYPLGNKDSMINIKVTEDKIESIGVDIETRIYKVPHIHYDLKWCQSILLDWFYHRNNTWHLRYKLSKEIVKHINGIDYSHDIEQLTNNMVLVFSLGDNNNNKYRLILVKPIE